MLILVVVTINLATNGDLFAKARTAETGTQREVERENLLAALISGFNNGDFDITAVKLPNDMKWCNKDDTEYTGQDTINPTKGEGCWVITRSNNKFYVDGDGSISDESPITYGDALAKGWVYVDAEDMKGVMYGGAGSVSLAQTINNVPAFKQGEDKEMVFEGYQNIDVTQSGMVVSFCQNEKIESVDFNGLNVTLEADGFAYCINLKSVTGMEGMTEIQDGTFEGCTNLTNITIPKNITSIGEDVFKDCTSLTNITINKEENSISGAPWGATSATITWQK